MPLQDEARYQAVDDLDDRPTQDPWPVMWEGRQVGQLDREGTITIWDVEILKLVHA